MNRDTNVVLCVGRFISQVWLVLFGLIGVAGGLPLRAAEEEPGKGEYWRTISRVRGRVSIEVRGGKNERNAHSYDTWDNTETVQVDFTLDRVRRKEPEMPKGLTPELAAYMRGQWAQEEAASDIVVWRAAPGTVKIAGRSFQTNASAFFPVEKQLTTSAEFSGVSLYELALELKVDTGEWQLTSPNKLKEKYRIINKGVERHLVTNETGSLDSVHEFDAVDSLVFNGTLGGKPGPVHGAAKVESAKTADNPHSWSTRLGRIDFWPEFADVEVEVTIDGYAKWRPEGSITKPTQPGNHLVARGTLVPKAGGRLEDMPGIKKFRFELLDTSSEPGVCLNWPLGAQYSDFDLRLSEASAMSAGQLSKKDQTNEVVQVSADENKRPYAETRIDSYDFGGKATLRVICELADGREIVGVMKGDGAEEPLILVPKMAGPGWIAESWRKERQVEKLADEDDDEKVEGQRYHGDGFTLYEEYRGWVQKGKRLEGDPEKKDFFVLNQIGTGGQGSDGPDGRAGLALFARASKLRVHGKITPAEFDWRVRVMNANRRDGPHRVAQHGVFITDIPWKYGEVRGGKTTLSDESRSGRPATAVSIGILKKTDVNSVFTDETNKVANLTKSAAGSVYTRAVAHELAHAVGAEHHGEWGDHAQTVYFQGAGDPSNPTRRARFVESSPRTDFEYGAKQILGRPPVWSDFDRGATISLYWEDKPQEEIAASLEPEFERALNEERADPIWDRSGEAARRASDYSRYGKDANFWGELALYTEVAEGSTKAGWKKHHDAKGGSFDKFIYAADPQGLQSGDELCLMRYYFANAYPLKGRKNAYYVIRTPSRIGNDLCRGSAGTGANDKDHKPQSRFGDSAPGRGRCFEQICPNDAIPAPKS